MAERIVVALGGNALLRQGDGASAAAQQRVAAKMAHQLVPLITSGNQLVIAYGNGPQVGDILLHQEAINTSETPTMPLDSCGAMSQGMIGYWLQQAIGNELRAVGSKIPVASVVTQVLVNRADPAFMAPSKPIGPFYKTKTIAQSVASKRGFVIKEDAGRGWRRVVPSPKPIAIIEIDMIRTLINSGQLVIAAGGGGAPVIEVNHKIHGVEAVIDKDRSAAILADSVRAKKLIILTSIDAVKINFGKSDETSLHEVTCEAMRQYCDDGEFASGSMLPKVQASLDFVEKQRGHRQAIIASLDNVAAAIKGLDGTIIS
jgi:carbamate kinase